MTQNLFPENFRYPYIARTVQEFWRRWHISLSTWFRDYLFMPLGVYRVSLARMYGNLMIVFLLCGLWHGASWNFVVWGLFHGTFLVVERLGLAAPLRHAYLLVVIMIGWVFSRADTLSDAAAFLKAMAGGGTADPTPYAVTGNVITRPSVTAWTRRGVGASFSGDRCVRAP